MNSTIPIAGCAAAKNSSIGFLSDVDFLLGLGLRVCAPPAAKLCEAHGAMRLKARSAAPGKLGMCSQKRNDTGSEHIILNGADRLASGFFSVRHFLFYEIRFLM